LTPTVLSSVLVVRFVNCKTQPQHAWMLRSLSNDKHWYLLYEHTEIKMMTVYCSTSFGI